MMKKYFSTTALSTHSALSIVLGFMFWILSSPSSIGQTDYGDAPNSYGTLSASGGPSHNNSSPGARLGQRLDSENDGQPSIDADGDDQDIDAFTFDDEDGVTFLTSLVQGGTSVVRVVASPGSDIAGWIDFNRNGVFDHPPEQIFFTQANGSGTNEIPFIVPTGATTGRSYARFRCWGEAGPNTPLGMAGTGEVEDYSVNLLPPGSPQIICPADVNRGCNPPALPPPNISDVITMGFCTPPTVTHLGDNIISLGGCTVVVERVYQAIDSCQQALTCTQRFVEVVDTTRPSMNVPPDVTNCNLGTGTNVAGVATATDDCGVPMITFFDTTNTMGCVTRVDRVWTATDACGNMAVATQLVENITDNETPFLTIPPDTTLCNMAPSTNLTGAATLTDNCMMLAPNLSFSDVTNTVGCTQIVSRTWVGTDQCGNSTNANQLIYVINDILPPTVVSGPTGATVSCVEDVPPPELSGFILSDNCSTSAELMITVTTNSIGDSCSGTVTYTYFISDTCGNTTPYPQVFNIEDVTPPALLIPDDIVLDCFADTSTNTLGIATGIDDCVDQTVNISFSDNVTTGACANTFTITRAWTATDSCGNQAVSNQVIVVTDLVPPSFICPTNVTVQGNAFCQAPVPDFVSTISATDNCSTNPIVTQFPTAGTLVTGPTTTAVVITAVDECGNTNSCSVDFTVTCGNENIDVFQTVDASCVCSNDFITFDITVTNTGSTALNNVSINDIHYPGCSTNLGTLLPGNAITVNCQVNATNDINTVIATGTGPNTTVMATNTIPWIMDTMPPVVLSGPTGTTVSCVSDVPLPDINSFTVMDNCSGSSNVVITVTTNTTGNSCSGAVEYSYTISDTCGNSTIYQQIFIVEDLIAPLISIPPDVTLGCFADTSTNALGAATGIDNCIVHGVTITHSDTFTAGACANNFTITRTWSATDACGNQAMSNQVITVVDSTPPSFSCPTNITAEGNAFCQATLPDFTSGILPTDDCTTSPSLSQSPPAGTLVTGPATFVVTLTATDECGNSTNCTVNFIVDCPTFDFGDAPDSYGTTLGANGARHRNPLTPLTPQLGSNVDEDIDGQPSLNADGDDLSGGADDGLITLDPLYRGRNVEVVTRVTRAPGQLSMFIDFDSNGTFDFPQERIVFTNAMAGLVTNQFTVPVTSIITSNTYLRMRVTSSTNDLLAIGEALDGEIEDYRVAITGPALSCSNLVFGCNPGALLDPNPANVATNMGFCGMPIISHLGDSITNIGCQVFIERIYEAFDPVCSSSLTCTQMITYVDDTIIPTLTVPADVSGCNISTNSLDTGVAVATDACSTNVLVSFSDSINMLGCTQLVTRTWTALDDCGNSTSAVQVIENIMDATLPILTVPADVSGCNISTNSLDTGVAVATDACSTNVLVSFSDSINMLGCTQLVTRTWTALDDCGNSTSAVQVIENIMNTTPPSLTIPPDVVGCNLSTNIINTGNATATTSCGTATVSFTDSVSFIGCIQIIDRLWTAQDGCNNTTQAVQRIENLNDTDTPIISNGPSNMVLQCAEEIPPPDPGLIFATDGCDTNLNIFHVSDNPLDSSCPTIIQRVYRVVDDCGNSTNWVQTITVGDTTPPTIMCPNTLTLVGNTNCQAVLPDLTSTNYTIATDNCSATLSISQSVPAGTLLQGPTPTNITVFVTDGCNNQTSCDILIDFACGVGVPLVSHTADLLFACSNDTVTLTTIIENIGTDTLTNISLANTFYPACNSTNLGNLLPGAIITNTCIVNVTNEISEVVVTGATGGSNMTDTAQAVITIDTEAPMIILPMDLAGCNLPSTNVAITGTATATDNSGSATVSFSDFVQVNGCTTTIQRTWMAIDACGNSAQSNQFIVSVNDTTPPLLVIPPNVATCSTSLDPTTTGFATATDDCATPIVSYVDGTITTGTPFPQFERMWVAVDACGNATTNNQTIIIDEAADLALSITATPDTAIPSDPVFITAGVTNTGPCIANGVVVTVDLASDFNFVAANNTNCMLVGNEVICNVGSLSSGGGTSIVIEVSIANPMLTTLTNIASVSGTNFDPVLLNNTNNYTVGVAPMYQLTLLDDPNAYGSILGATNGIYLANSRFDLVSDPIHPKYVFDRWVVNGSSNTTAHPFNLGLVMDTTVQVFFASSFIDVTADTTNQLHNWRFDFNSGLQQSDLTICNQATVDLRLTEPFWYGYPKQLDQFLVNPDGVTNGVDYIDITAQVNAQLLLVGNNDLVLDPGECVTVTNIAWYYEAVQPFGGQALARVYADPPAAPFDEAEADTDGDGIKNGWEDTYGLNKHHAYDADRDFDRDGMTSLQEFLADTDPENASSLLRISEITFDTLGANVQWQGGTSVTQYIEWASTPSGPWTCIYTNRPPTTVNGAVLQSLLPDGSGIYRITTGADRE